MNKCQQCGTEAQTPLCKNCAKHMRRQITSLAKPSQNSARSPNAKHTSASAVVVFVVVSLVCR